MYNPMDILTGMMVDRTRLFEAGSEWSVHR